MGYGLRESTETKLAPRANSLNLHSIKDSASIPMAFKCIFAKQSRAVVLKTDIIILPDESLAALVRRPVASVTDQIIS